MPTASGNSLLGGASEKDAKIDFRFQDPSYLSVLPFVGTFRRCTARRLTKEKALLNYEPFLKHLQTLRKGSSATIKSYRNDLRLFESFAHQRAVTEARQINHAIVRDYIEWLRHKPNRRTGKLGLADASIARRLAALSSFLDFTRATSDLDRRNPLKGLPNKWQKNNEPKPVEEYTLDLLLASIPNERDRVLFTMLVATGLRVSEIQQLNRDSITIEAEIRPNGEERITGFGEVVGKGGKRRKFYVDETTLLAWAAYLQTRTDKDPALFISERVQRMSVRAIQERLAHWCKQIGFAHINVHRLRHTYATRLANAHISSMVLKDLMGHNSFSTTQKYFKLTDTTLAQGYFAAMEHLRK
jgi:site-specific recombinase XerD